MCLQPVVSLKTKFNLFMSACLGRRSVSITPRNGLALFFSFYRNLLARKQNARLDRQRDLGWKLFGKVPLREAAQKDSKKTQKVSPWCVKVCL